MSLNGFKLRLGLMLALVVATIGYAVAQTGQCPPGGCVGGTAPPPQQCTQTTCGPASPFGFAPVCTTSIIPCPPPPPATCYKVANTGLLIVIPCP